MEPQCLLKTSEWQVCPSNCKSFLATSQVEIDVKSNCIAKQKLKSFYLGKTTFQVGMTAFQQCPSILLAEFLSESKENYELITYYLYLNEPKVSKGIIEAFSPDILGDLFEYDFENYLKLRSKTQKERFEKNFFKVKSYRYWTYLDHNKICEIIVYLVRNKNNSSLASQFLMVLPSHIISNLKNYTDFLPEEEKSLYQALGDTIYELPIQSPKIYSHMMQLFSDDIEISLILGTMEELVNRQAQILNLTEKLLEYTDKRTIDLDIQYIFSELNGYDPLVAMEVLSQLMDREKITKSQRDTLVELLQKGSIDVLRNMKLKFQV